MFSSNQIVNDTIQSLVTIDAIDASLSILTNDHMSQQLLLAVGSEEMIEVEIEVPVDFMDVPADDEAEIIFLFYGSISPVPLSWEVEPAPATSPGPAPAPRLVRAPSRGRERGYAGFSLRLI